MYEQQSLPIRLLYNVQCMSRYLLPFLHSKNSKPMLQAVAFGMGGGLLQRLNRDTMSFATKLSHIEYADGTSADVMKLPKTDPLKFSLPGIMAVKMVEGVPTAFPAEGGHVKPEENMLHVVWDNGPVQVEHLPISFVG